MNLIEAELLSTRSLLYKAATKVDHDSMENAYASLAKVKATALAEKAMFLAIQLIGLEYF